MEVEQMTQIVQSGRWEYLVGWTGGVVGADRIVRTDGADDEAWLGASGVEIDDAMQTLGAQGWELVAVDRRHFEHLEEHGGTLFGRPILSSTAAYIFKRPHR
jgi:hypothetical protein